MNSMPEKSLMLTMPGADEGAVSGAFMDFDGERCYVIRNVDHMEAFFISVISDVDHWLFASSNGGLTAGRISPDTALFPYVSVDKIHDSPLHTGSKTIVRVTTNGELKIWEPFNKEHDSRYSICRNLYKTALGNKLCFEEINQDLQLAFRYTWATSDAYGFVRQCCLENLGDQSVSADFVDGLQNILPAGTPRVAQTSTSNLVNAYKWSELDEPTGLAFLTLYAQISDRAEPSESLKATTVFCLGLKGHKVLVSSEQLEKFRLGGSLEQEVIRRGKRGGYLVNHTLELAPQASQRWEIIADIEQSQAEVVALRRQLGKPDDVRQAVARSVKEGSDNLARIMGGSDGFQATAEENVTEHHYANVMFNVLRGGIFDNHYTVSAQDFRATIRHFNREVYRRNFELLQDLPNQLAFNELLAIIRRADDPQLERLSYEYLPITFGRRHGDPSRPWNHFAIKLKDDKGERLLSYEGNWRDIFQNWEALLFSYPEFIENVIAKFVNASTLDGYNPYRITKEGIDWEVEEPDNPWSHIGYWGDHQIIYLLKLLEQSRDFHPNRLSRLLRKSIFCYANVPYRIAAFESLLEDPKNTVAFDEALAERIEQRVATMGADGKLLRGGNGEVCQVNLFEKLLVPLLSKLGNLVIDGGIWLNAQRPEWNDANNALVGNGLSMVTMYYMRRYVRFLQQLLAEETESFALSAEINQWLADTALALGHVRPLLGGGPIEASDRFRSLTELGQAACRYRQAVYEQESLSRPVDRSVNEIMAMLDDALAAIDHSIGTNRREDGLYHAYNLLDLQQEAVAVDTLYPMLEGQVAVLSAGAIDAEEAADVLEALFDSAMYRPGQRSFMLYPDRHLPGFLEKNHLQAEQVEAIPLLQQMLAAGDEQIVLRDADGNYRFTADFTNVGDLEARLIELEADYSEPVAAAREPLRALYESVFRHKEFTGRSGTMFGFEGLGSIYWHMITKLMLAVMENFFTALKQDVDQETRQRLGQLYYRVREGIGFNKTPGEYGAFPTDPYSHTPKHAGARQPGMTGQVKEEILCRFGELGICVNHGIVSFKPALLRAQEFAAEAREFCYLDVGDEWQTIEVPARSLAFTWCQIPIVYRLDNEAAESVLINRKDGTELNLSELEMPIDLSDELFRRSSTIRQITVTFGTDQLFTE
jgi:hypothetical protein